MAYQERIGSLIYPAVTTRPDIAQAASVLSQFNTNPSPEHLREADRVICYLNGTKWLGPFFDGRLIPPGETAIDASSDASFADDQQTRKSTQGYVFMAFQGPIAWKSSKQTSVTTSTTEAELLSLYSIKRADRPSEIL